ncbi:MAG TPA: HAMP domain-containing sensor histidine kinase [Streptosporangiaceae bacterium]|nr:HAMP domain-containing sensor histidine kinase [Streptosporangiaceae bacterium]
MSLTGERRGWWRSIGQLPGRTPLRVKLITAVLALVAIALVVISLAGLGFLKSYLISQADDNLATLAQNSPAQVLRHYLFGQVETGNGFAIDWLPRGGTVHPVYQDTTGYGVNSTGSGTTGQVRPGPEIIPGASWLSGKQVVTVGATSGNGRFRVLAIPNVTISNQSFLEPGSGSSVTGTLIFAVDVTNAYQTIGKLTGIDVIVSGILLLGLAIVGVTVIRTSLRPLTDIERTAEAIAAGELSRRVPERDPRTEIGRLGRSLNTMLAQIETAFHARSASEIAARRSEDRMRQFVADASHELRTPLTAIRGFAEYYRQRGGVAAAPGEIEGPPGPESGGLPAADLDRIMRRVEQESSRMGVLVEDMLLLARLDQQRPLERRTVDLLTLTADAVHDARVVAPGRSINLTVGAGAALLVLGDEVRLRQVIGNLMSNALSHTPEGTPIDVRIRSGSLDEAHAPGPRGAGSAQPVLPGLATGPPAPAPAAGPRSAAVLEVTDHGPGLSREQAEHAFERFYRADQARTTGGTGLGLAIVAALVAAHDGAVWVESAPGAGATFRIALPLSPDALHVIEHDDADDHDTELPIHHASPAAPRD